LAATVEEALGPILERRIDGCRKLISCERLSGGASQETYRIVIATDAGERKLAMRRAPGKPGDVAPHHGVYPGLATEAELIRAARAAGVPEPEIFWVLTPEDGLGDGFIMEWLDGEALGARMVPSAPASCAIPRSTPSGQNSPNNAARFSRASTPSISTSPASARA